MATAATAQIMPDFIQAINADYKAQVSHTFILHGNIYDFCDNGSGDLGIEQVLAARYDDNIQADMQTKGKDEGESGLQQDSLASPKTRIVAFYTGRGLDFPNEKSEAMFVQAFRAVLSDEEFEALGENFQKCTRSLDHTLRILNKWFYVSKTLAKQNLIARKNKTPQTMELVVTLVFKNADAIFPKGEVANLQGDRAAIVNLRDWAQDQWVGARNRVILMTRHLDDIHSSIRSELARAHSVRKPNLQDRLEWMTNYDASIKYKVTKSGHPLTIGQNSNVTGIIFAEDFDLQMAGIQSAGMNRRQLKDAVMTSWRTSVPLDSLLIRTRKKEALDTEYNGQVDIKEGEFGFEEVGGHAHFKKYCIDNIIKPLKAGNKRLCSRGALMSGPPGTGKSVIAWALAKESGLNFLSIDLGKVFGGLVGETESNMRKLIEAIEAAAPCIVFIDEIDSVLSSGRQSGGDSGTSARVFNNFMTWMSDPGRRGKVVVMAATNRPDLLDKAMIRKGRFDAIIPMLPPQKTDKVGRWNILAALTKKHKAVFANELKATKDDPTKGLGLLLFDDKRVWTGAEIEGVVEKSLIVASQADRKKAGKPDWTIKIEDFEHAMKTVYPSTGDMTLQIKLALQYWNDLDCVPVEWQEEALKQKAAYDVAREKEIDDVDDLVAA